MITEWDYTDLAGAYLERPDYSGDAIDSMLSIAGISAGAEVCDVGAGVAHLTLMLASRGLSVSAVEPNDAMRSLGRKRTEKWTSVLWKEGTGEATEQPSGYFNLVTFGSSFNVCDRQQALKEVARILKPNGWFACMWNHRRLEDTVQSQIELLIKEHVPSYGYGSRREDQRDVIDASNLFNTVVQLNAPITHEQTVQQCVEAWRSHATLARQAGEKFDHVVDAIEGYLDSLSAKTLKVPYLTNIWMAQLR
ncbi:MAG: methyltransferase [Rhodospirillaceae bacterium]|nr:methyltransferase [Rhodospirillaceae bacterium]